MEFTISQKIEDMIKKDKKDALMRCNLYGHDYQEIDGISGGKICICCGSRPEDKNKTGVESEKSCKTCLWDNKPRNERCLACLEKDEFIGWQQKLE